MSIINYTSYFHDGSLINIIHHNSVIIFSIESAEISAEENLDNILLSDHSTIKGKLHLEEVESVKENGKPFLANLKMLHDSAGILHLNIRDNTINLDLEWVNFPPHPEVSAYSFYSIQAKKIWWENIPDLFDPFC